MGTNAKLHVELRHKTWPALGFSGATYGEWDGYCCAWDDSVPLGPMAARRCCSAFPAARRQHGSDRAGPRAAPTGDLALFLAQIEPVYPGTRAAYTGRAYEDHWALDPGCTAPTPTVRVGQAATFGRIAGRPRAASTSPASTPRANQGFLDGAVETGERAARALAAADLTSEETRLRAN